MKRNELTEAAMLEAYRAGWLFGRRVWDNGKEWYLEHWNGEDWVEFHGKSLPRLVAQMKRELAYA